MQNKLKLFLAINTILSLIFILPAYALMVMFVMGGASVGSVEKPSEGLLNAAMYIVYAGIALPFSIIPSIILSWIFYKGKMRNFSIISASFHWILLITLLVTTAYIFSQG